ncbi:MAG: hypothetical protein MI684_01820 [Chlorobiales bacterium]|nr:hypothetical protein [Chlorobiales bacterium]
MLKNINHLLKKLPFYLPEGRKNKVGTVKVNYTPGAGNNIFQYVFGRLLAEHHGMNLSAGTIDVLENPAARYPLSKNLETITIRVNDENNLHKFFDQSTPCNFIIKTYAEDFTIYKPHLNKIRSWFDEVPTTNTEDLVFHLRLGDRLVLASTYHPSMLVTPQEFCEAIETFSFKKLHIVTDMPLWRKITPDEVNKMRFHCKVPQKKRIDPDTSADYFNALYNTLSTFNPIVRTGYSVKEDFDFFRSFSKILFQHGTLVWWAAALSKAKQVGVFGPWRPVKNRNKNLGQTDFPGWFQWGNNRK